MSLKKKFPAVISELTAMIDFIRKQLMLSGLDISATRKIELASEEALVNVVEHGYRGRNGQIEIEMSDSCADISITIRDQGPPFNPLQKEVGFDPHATLEERKIGGLGILFMRRYVDEIHYKRENNANILILVNHKLSR